LIVHAKKHEVETIKRLVSQLDVNIYGGRRVFIYYAEKAKSKELAATLNAIYGARDARAPGSSAAALPSPTPRPAGRPPPPPRRPRGPPPPPDGRARRPRRRCTCRPPARRHSVPARLTSWPRGRCGSSPTRSPTR